MITTESFLQDQDFYLSMLQSFFQIPLQHQPIYIKSNLNIVLQL